MAIKTDGNHVTGDVPSGKHLAIFLRDGKTEIINGPAQVDVWKMHRGVALYDFVADVPANIDPPTLAETIAALADLAGEDVVRAKVAAQRAAS